MKVTFIINEPIRKASGGYKIVYEYANALDDMGHKVEIIYRCRKDILFSNYSLPWIVKKMVAKFIANSGPNWFDLNKTVKRNIVSDINDKTVNDSNIVIATAVDTAEDVKNLSVSKGSKIYLIQGYETWVYPEKKVHETYQYQMTKIVVAKWLGEIVDKYSNESSYYISNGVDRHVYKVINEIEERDRFSIAMMYHDLESKGSADGIEVLIKLKEKYKSLNVNLFGIPQRPKELPSWINYTCCATKEEVVEIYNKSSIFLCTSWTEGFGLTGAEAMMCGCALVSTETLGVKEYANENLAKLVPIRRIDLLIEACINLIENNLMRINMAKLGQKHVTELLNIENSKSKFINLLLEKK